ncbi:MAG: N-acetyltransferase [Alphaproteobacteria bacterium]|nr:N-acetyltransferase [Alphaproteobacteria bacterium]
MQPCIRFANIDDLSSLLEIEELSFSKHDYDLLKKQNYEYLIKKSNSDIRICEINKKPIGSSIIFYRKNAIYSRLYSIAVIPEHQNKGIGKLLLEDAELISQKRGLTEIRQEIRSDRNKLYEKYKEYGYSEYARSKNYYPDGSGCIKLKKIIQC